MELWKDVVGYEGYYQVSDHGRIRCVERVQRSYGGRSWIKPAKILNPTFDGRYMIFSLSKDGSRKRAYIHDLVLTAFVGERPGGFHCCHGDGNGQNNVLSNLRWDTPSANNQDKEKHNTLPVGERHGMNKYSNAQILEVKRLIKRGLNATEIERQTGVHRISVTAIRAGRQWKHVTLPPDEVDFSKAA